MTFKEFAYSIPHEERMNREMKAASAETTPIEKNTEDKTAVFSGKSGISNTSLTKCTCQAFHRNPGPCKHMFRLAYVLGEYPLENVVSDISKVKQPMKSPAERAAAYEHCISIIESYPEESQQALQKVLARRYKNVSYVCSDYSSLQPFIDAGLLIFVDDPNSILTENGKKKTVDALLATGFSYPRNIQKTVKARFEWCLENAAFVCSRVYSNWYALYPTGDLEVANRKVYTYLNNKYGRETPDWIAYSI